MDGVIRPRPCMVTPSFDSNRSCMTQYHFDSANCNIRHPQCTLPRIVLRFSSASHKQLRMRAAIILSSRFAWQLPRSESLELVEATWHTEVRTTGSSSACMCQPQTVAHACGYNLAWSVCVSQVSCSGPRVLRRYLEYSSTHNKQQQ